MRNLANDGSISRARNNEAPTNLQSEARFRAWDDVQLRVQSETRLNEQSEAQTMTRLKRRPKSKPGRRLRSGQTSFLQLPKDTFIGSDRRAGHRDTHAKIARPLSRQKPIHVCFRSKFAKGKRTMLGTNKIKVNRLVTSISKRYGIKLKKYVNVGNHLHLVVRLSGSAMTARRQYRSWIRLLTARIAFEIGGSKKGLPFRDENGQRAKFWDAIPFSRVVHGLRGWSTMDRYTLKNQFESQGLPKLRAIALARELFESSRSSEIPDW